MKFFICSTAYDLSDFRGMVINLLKAKGHEVLHHENPTFVSKRGLHSHDLCVLAVKEADIVLCIIDKRYGGEFRGKTKFKDQILRIKGKNINGKSIDYDQIVPSKNLSVTWCELITAYHEKKIVMTFVRQRLLDEKETRRFNQYSRKFTPAFAQRNEMFDLLDWITKQEKRNWIAPFYDIEDFKTKILNWVSAQEKKLNIPGFNNDIQTKSRKCLILVEDEVELIFIEKTIKYLKLENYFQLINFYSKYRLLNEFGQIVEPGSSQYDKLLIIFNSELLDKEKDSFFRKAVKSYIPAKHRKKVAFTIITPWFYDCLILGLKKGDKEKFNKMERLNKLNRNSSNQALSRFIKNKFDVSQALAANKDFLQFSIFLKSILWK